MKHTENTMKGKEVHQYFLNYLHVFESLAH